jgi:hypothetical protein
VLCCTCCCCLQLDKMVCLVNELLPVTFMDSDSDEDDTDVSST